MPDNINLILMLVTGITAAVIFGLITHHLRLSPIVGYLLAGIVIGPHTPGFVADEGIALQCAEIGVILLMFGVGLHFHFKDLWAVKEVAIFGAIIEIICITTLSATLLSFFGWPWIEGIILGMGVSVASTVVLLRVLADNNTIQTASGHLAIGWLIVEDIFIIFVLVLLPVLVGTGEISNGGLFSVEQLDSLYKIALAIFKIALFVALMLITGKRIIPWILLKASKTGSRELFTLTVLTIALGIAVGSAKLFGASMALGAFLAGMIVGQSEFSARAASDALPMRDAFAVLFFVSIGMLLDPAAVLDLWPIMLAMLAVIILVKPLLATTIVYLLGRPLQQALLVGLALAQIGELSFVLTAVASKMKLLSPQATSVLVFASIVSIVLNPILYRMAKPISQWFNSRGWLLGLASEFQLKDQAVAHEYNEHHVIVVGYGPVGRTVANILKEVNISCTIIEMNVDTVRALRSQNLNVVHGDASSREILRHAGIEQAEGLVISVMSNQAQAIVQAARDLNPQIEISVATTYLKDMQPLIKSGVSHVFTAEGEIALAMADQMMKVLGATAEQIERENTRIREQYFAPG